jgi:hypothetical protein
MVGAGRVAGGRPDAAVVLADQRRASSVFVAGVAPVIAAHLRVQPLGTGFGEAVGDRFQDDRAVIVVGGGELGELGSSIPKPAPTAKAPIQSGVPRSATKSLRQ